MNKKILIGIVTLIIISILGFSVWHFFRDKEVPTNINPTTGLPFGEGGGNIIFDGESNTPGAGGSTSQINQLFQISSTPTAGFVIFSPRTDAPAVIRYVDRATGHIYEVNPFTMEKTRITNNTLPKILEAHFRKDGSAVLLRFMGDNNTIENISVALTAPQSTTTNSFHSITATNLRGNMGEVSVGPSGRIAYFLLDDSSISIANFDGSNATKLLSMDFTDWRISWDNPNVLNVFTKASASVSGFAYTLNTQTGSMNKILGPLNGLTALVNPDNSRVAYSYNSDNKIIFSAQNIATGLTTNLLPVTLAEKCVWSKKDTEILYCGTPTNIDASEPDNWYRGISRFSDQIWIFNTLTEAGENIFDPENSSNRNLNIDMINPALSPEEDYLVFINKNDLTLWAVRLK